jgi:hypothetical protein
MNEWVWRVYSGMILTGENQTTHINLCPSSTSYTTNPSWTGKVWNLGLHGERPETNCLSHCMAISQTKALFSSLQDTAGLSICISSLTDCQTSLKYLNFHLTHCLSLCFLTMLSVCEKGLLSVEHHFALSFKSNKFCLRREPLIPSVFSVWWLSVLEWMSAPAFST